MFLNIFFNFILQKQFFFWNNFDLKSKVFATYKISHFPMDFKIRQLFWFYMYLIYLMTPSSGFLLHMYLITTKKKEQSEKIKHDNYSEYLYQAKNS